MTGNTSTSVKRILFIFIAGLSIVPTIQKAFRPVNSASLEGYFEPNPFPRFSFTGLFTGLFLDSLTKHYNPGIGFHNELVRLRNQADFSLFRIPNARNVVIGKEDYLYEKPYIISYTGRDFIGIDKIEARVRQFRAAQDWLKNKKGIFLVVLLLPDKGTYYPEYIPDRFLKPCMENTNYAWYGRKLKEQKINFIDYNAWFRSIKDTSGYPLFPKTGIHWSSYGSFLAMDSLVRYLEAKTGSEFPHPELVRNRISKIPRDRDDDMERILNLVCGISSPPMAYPEVGYSKPLNHRPFPALFIGDSFYFTWAEAGYIGNIFMNRDFWYYDHHVYYGTYPTGKLTATEDMNRMLARFKAIIILQTTASSAELGYYFIERLFEKAGS